MRAHVFKPGQVTKIVWCGDGVTECEFIRDLGRGALLFYDCTTKYFRRAYWETFCDRGAPQFLLNGWECSKTPFRS